MTQAINIRLFTYKSFRHYGGREITTTAHICKAEFVKDQGHTKNCKLLEDCAGFLKGHTISVDNKDYDLKNIIL